MNTTEGTSATAVGGSALSERLGPCAWWVPHFEQPIVGREPAKPMLWPEAKPLYELTTEEVAAVNKLRARKVWQTRQTHLCRCDHNEYCRHCWPESFRPGGVWHGLGD